MRNQQQVEFDSGRDYWLVVKDQVELEPDLASAIGLTARLEIADFVRALVPTRPVDVRQVVTSGGIVQVRCQNREWTLSIGPELGPEVGPGARPGRMTPVRADSELEAELDLYRRRFHATARIVPLGLQLLDANGRPKYANDTLHRILGMTEDRVDPDLAESLIHADDLDRVVSSFHSFTTSDRDMMTERYRVVGGDGVVRVVEVGTIRLRDESGGTSEYASYVMELSDESHALTLADSTESDSHSLAIGQVGHWSWTRSVDRLTLSETMYQIYGLEPGSEVTADSVQSLIPTEQRFMVEREVQKSIEENRGWEAEHDIILPDGELRRVISRGRSIQADGDVRMVGMVIDVSAQREREQQIRQAEKLRAIGQLASGVAHDFNNMLGAIVGNATVLSEEVPPALQRPVAEIQIAAERVTQLTRKLLTFSRQQQIERAPNDIHELLDEVFALVAHSFTNGVQLKRRMKAARTRVMCDPSQIQSAFLNIVVNARDAMQDNGGLLQVETRNVEIDESQWVEVIFRDDGPGMTEETRRRAFEPFFTTRRDEGGTGLGLSATYGAVLRHGGEIDLDSTVNVGTTFKLRFRTLSDQRHDDQQFDRPSRDDRGAGRTIWLVDDEPLMRSLASRVLKRASYEVIAFESASEVLEALEDRRPDLFLIDHQMPGMSGTGLVEELRNRDVNLPIVMVTGNAFDIDEDWARRAEVSSIVEKPYAVDDLLGAVDV